MLYQLYETQRSLMEPFSDLALAAAKLYSNPLSLAGQSPFAQRLSASYDLMHRLGKDYEKPEFGLRTIDVRTLTEAAEVLGARRATILLRVIFPNISSAILSGAFLTFAVVIGEFTMASLLDRPAFGPYLQLIGANRAYEPSALAVIAFIVTWASMGLINVFGRSAHRKPTR